MQDLSSIQKDKKTIGRNVNANANANAIVGDDESSTKEDEGLPLVEMAERNQWRSI